MSERYSPSDINNMSLGDLVHTMMVEFQPGRVAHDDDGAYLQSNAYFWAKERLDKVLMTTER